MSRHTLRKLHGVGAFEAMLSAFTDAVFEKVVAWQSRPLEVVYAIAYFCEIVLRNTTMATTEGSVHLTKRSPLPPLRSLTFSQKLRSSQSGQAAVFQRETGTRSPPVKIATNIFR